MIREFECKCGYVIKYEGEEKKVKAMPDPKCPHCKKIIAEKSK